jgi:hydroxylaminobenzene mutase
MLQIGIGLFVFSGLEGFAIPHLRAPHLGRSVHKLSGLQGVITLALGLLWPRLNLSATSSRIAFWTFIYSSFATLIPFVMAAIWGAGNTTIPQAAGAARGSALQEVIIKVVLYSAAAPFFVSMALILWGLRIVDMQAPHSNRI